MFSAILLVAILLGYVILLICKHKHSSNHKIDAAVQFAQAVLWCLIAVDNWNSNGTTLAGKCMNILYIVIVILSAIQGISTLRRRIDKDA